MTTEAQIFQVVIDLCEAGFQAYSRANYDKIVSALSPLEPSDRVNKMRRLAEAGHTLSSPRFAYPHIEGEARAALEASK